MSILQFYAAQTPAFFAMACRIILPEDHIDEAVRPIGLYWFEVLPRLLFSAFYFPGADSR